MSEEKKDNSGYRAEVVEINMVKHENADSLSVAKVFDGYNVVLRTTDWENLPRNKDGKLLGIYIPPDTIVDSNRPEFKFLSGNERIRAKKLRGIISFGLMIPAPIDANIGDDYYDVLGLKHYQPGEAKSNGGEKYFSGGETDSGPNVYAPKYDLENARKYLKKMFIENEEIHITEKIDGQNSRFVFSNGKMHCGSRTEWKREYPCYNHITLEFLQKQGYNKEESEQILKNIKEPKQNNWWKLLKNNPCIEEFCKSNPDVILYGEHYGNVNCIKYFSKNEPNKFAAFDVMKDGKWLNLQEASNMLLKFNVPIVPSLLNSLNNPIKLNFENIFDLAEGKTLVKDAGENVIREGIVIRPVKEREDVRLGRCILKTVSGEYLEKYK